MLHPHKVIRCLHVHCSGRRCNCLVIKSGAPINLKKLIHALLLVAWTVRSTDQVVVSRVYLGRDGTGVAHELVERAMFVEEVIFRLGHW